MVLLDWPPPDHLGIGRKRGNSCQRKHPAAILAVGSSYPPTVAAQTRIVSAAGIRLDHRKSVRPFKGRFCNNISEFESYMPSQAVRSLSASGIVPGYLGDSFGLFSFVHGDSLANQMDCEPFAAAMRGQ